MHFYRPILPCIKWNIKLKFRFWHATVLHVAFLASCKRSLIMCILRHVAEVQRSKKQLPNVVKDLVLLARPATTFVLFATPTGARIVGGNLLLLWFGAACFVGR